MNKDAGRGNRLFITLRLESGLEVPFMVDTGATHTFFDKSLIPYLGDRIGTATIGHFGLNTHSGLYKMPNLYFGNTPLMTGSNTVAAGQFKMLSLISGRPVKGILGMDCLSHYCIQLDFEAGKIRFLDPDRLNTNQLGQAYPMTLYGNRPCVQHPGLLGGSTNDLLIDTGFKIDGIVLKEELKGHETGSLWTRFKNAWVKTCVKVLRGPFTVVAVRLPVRVQETTWEGNRYDDLKLGIGTHSIGLRFLARHLITLDFPHQTMYLAPTSAGPLK